MAFLSVSTTAGRSPTTYKFIGTPFTVLVSKDGYVIERRTGPQSEKASRKKREKLLQ